MPKTLSSLPAMNRIKFATPIAEIAIDHPFGDYDSQIAVTLATGALAVFATRDY
jgi:hypothetical protein